MRTLTLSIAAATAAVALACGVNALDHATPAARAADATDLPREAPRPFPTLSVSGVAEVSIAPDEAWLHLGVDSFFSDLDAAVEDNDERIKSVMKVLHDAGLSGKNLQTDIMSLDETTRYVAKVELRGYQVRRNITARVTDLGKVESLLQALVRSGVTRIDSVRFSHTQLAAKKAEARVEALKAARQKAEAMATALGQRVDKAVTVTEGYPGVSTISQPTYTNFVVNAGGASVDGDTFASGRIQIAVQVSAVFELR
ncbi:MAG: DUF541 domain-containing protein [Deltaproteobacteria bacterium]|nr:MAG: DUF541 domain-containing protein [Deltaproteobacteria bacterium]